MSDPFWMLAFVYTPLIVVALGAAAVAAHEWSTRREIAAGKAEAARKTRAAS